MLSEYGEIVKTEIVKTEIENIPTIRREIRIDCYVIMPNYLHIIACIVGDDGNRPENHRADCHPPLRESIPNMVQGRGYALIWQRSYHDHTLFSSLYPHRVKYPMYVLVSPPNRTISRRPSTSPTPFPRSCSLCLIINVFKSS
jgi:hypothetical protein